jgi:glycosyltransferase involved in cell wall biosynthesis
MPEDASAQRAELVIVIAAENHGWILDKIGTELHIRMQQSTTIHYASASNPLPLAHSYLFCHWALFERAAKKGELRGARSCVFYTHPPAASLLHQLNHIRLLRSADAIVSMSSTHGTWLRRRGLPRSMLHRAIPGVDHNLFTCDGSEARHLIGFCSSFYERKSPDLMLQIVRAMPQCQFQLVGRKWHEYERFCELERMQNFNYVEAPYEDWPALFRQMSVFVSPSQVEGGPIPLLEAMAAGACPVASRTGFAPDLIQHGENGYIVSVGASLETWVHRIEAARHLKAEVSSTVAHLTWDSFVKSVEAVV